MIKIYKDANKAIDEVLSRSEASADVYKIVGDIIADVRKRGDEALLEYTKKFDGADLESLKVSEEEIKAAYNEVDAELIEIMKEAAENIRAYHIKQVRNGYEIKNGTKVLGQKITPIEKVGLYVPGGTAAYPSTVLMNSIPAKIAGCEKIVIATPCSKEGKVKPAVLVAADIAGVSDIYKISGAQAIAALAYGTESVENVYKIVGPGNVFVAEAKRQVFGKVNIDMIAGPSEILVVSDGTGCAKVVASDMLSQAEHDKNASAVLVTTSESFALKVQEEIENCLKVLERCEIARASIDDNGKIIVCDTIEEAVEISNKIAPEHLELFVDNPFDLLPLVKNAGSVFMGKNCPEPLGDYFAGTNHTLPTGSAARFSSPLSVDDFIKKTSYTYYSESDLEKVCRKVERFAKEEGLTAHAKSAVVRFEK